MLFLNKKAFLLFSTILLLQLSGIQAQERLPEPFVTAKYIDKQIVEVLNSFEEEFQIQVFFKKEWLDSGLISIAFEKIPVAEAIDQLLQGSNLLLYVFQDNYVIMPAKKVALITGNMLDYSQSEAITDYGNMKIVGNFIRDGKIRKVKLYGRIADGADNETLIGATIVVNNSDVYTISGRDGEYSLEMMPGIYNLTVSCVGYENTYSTVQLLGEGELNIELFEKTQEIDEIRIYAQKADRNISGNQMSLVQLDAKSIKRLPSITGEKDILKSITMIPGIKSVGEFGTGINVRGGGEDQNLFLLEGAPVYNTSHVMGLLSVVNPDLVTNVTLHKGHISAEYGERVSSVMDIELKEFNLEKKMVGTGGIGIYNSRLTLKGSLLNQKLTYKVGGRTSYSDYLLTRIQDYYLMNSSARFHDLNALFDLNLKKDHITVSGYYSYDYFKYASLYKFDYGNQIVSVSWTHRFSGPFSSNLVLARSKYNIERSDFTDSLSLYTVNSDLRSESAKLRFTLAAITNNRIDFGLQAINYKIQPGEQKLIDSPEPNDLVLDPENGLELAAFVNDQWVISKKISLQLGLRYSQFINYGPGKVYSYDSGQSVSPENITDSTGYGSGDIIKIYYALDPRFLIKYQIASDKAIKFSYNSNVQYIFRVSYSSISSPEDVWKMSDTYVKPMRVNQVTIGYFQNFLNNQVEGSVELYYKDVQNILDFKNGAS
ncbi:MAG: TonB-dependent receptor, partial [Bacteroidales bacterium]